MERPIFRCHKNWHPYPQPLIKRSFPGAIKKNTGCWNVSECVRARAPPACVCACLLARCRWSVRVKHDCVRVCVSVCVEREGEREREWGESQQHTRKHVCVCGRARFPDTNQLFFFLSNLFWTFYNCNNIAAMAFKTTFKQSIFLTSISWKIFLKGFFPHGATFASKLNMTCNWRTT